MILNEPTQKQLNKYHKGCLIKDKFPSTSANGEIDVNFYKCDDLQNNSVQILNADLRMRVFDVKQYDGKTRLDEFGEREVLTTNF